MAFEPTFPTDRITYRDGQRLWARDLRDDKRRDERMRWLHVRYLHHTWGVALGYDIQLATSNTAVVLGPGYAIDRSGRDLLLARGLLIPAPDEVGAALYALTIRYRNGSGAADSCGCRGVCCCSTHQSPAEERPVISWKLPQDLQLGDDVPLVSASVAGGVIQNELDFRVRRHARRLVRPHIGWGSTDPGQTGWKISNKNIHTPLLQAVVDTSDAGFTNTPFYFAQVAGDFSGIVDQISGAEPWPGPSQPEFSVSSCSFIAQATAKNFTFDVLLGGSFPVGKPFSPDQLETRQWTVKWMGLEPVAGCAPHLALTPIFSLAGILTNLVAR